MLQRGVGLSASVVRVVLPCSMWIVAFKEGVSHVRMKERFWHGCCVEIENVRASVV